MNTKGQYIVINTRSILVLFFLIFLGYVIWTIQSVIIAIFFSLILALALEPIVNWFVKKRMPHALAVLLTVFSVVGGLIALMSIAVTPLFNQIQILVVNFPSYLEKVVAVPGASDFTKKINDAVIVQLSQAGGSVVTVTLGAFSTILSIVLIVAITVYLLLDARKIRLWIFAFFPKNRRHEIENLVVSIEQKLGGWLRGEGVLMLVVGTMTFIGLSLLGFEYALALSVLAGLLEIIPIMGPIISAIPAVIIGFNISPVIGFAVLGLYILVQQCENNLVVPKVMQRAIGLNPLITLLVLMVGADLYGTAGALLSIPTTIVLFEVFGYILGIKIPYFSEIIANEKDRERELNRELKEHHTAAPSAP